MCKKFSWKACDSEKQLIKSIIHQPFLIHVSYNNAIILMECSIICQFVAPFRSYVMVKVYAIEKHLPEGLNLHEIRNKVEVGDSKEVGSSGDFNS